jgi:putative NADPH-quinone reductase
VIRPPYAYDFPENDSGGGLPIGKLKGKSCVVFNTANTAEEREENYFGDPLEKIWRKCICGFCGIDKYYRKVFGIVVDSDIEQRRTWLHETENLVEDVIKSVMT